ncbi:MAG: PhoH family protein [Elusimicrobia bacterium]|nr:PhoH family protein [Elusimicrobiota bacterium]
MIVKKLKLKNPDEAIIVMGAGDFRLKQIEREFKVDVFVRHDAESNSVVVSVRGPNSRVDKAMRAFKRALLPQPHDGKSQAEREDKDVVFYSAHSKAIKPRSPKQEEYIKSIFDHDMVIALGPAGTGKTFLAVAAALRALEMNIVDKIVLTRPIVEAGEKLGFLPGDLHEKVNPYLRPLYDGFNALLGPERFRMFREDDIIEIVPLAYMRGRTLENAFIILDEAQNTLPEQIKMFLTRMGLNSKVVVTGDITQIDLENKSRSGLVQILRILKKISAIKFIEFGKEDVVRHALVKEILSAYEEWENGKPA